MRIIIAGSRTFRDYEFLCKKMDQLTRNLQEVIILTGGAKGADKLGEKWCFQQMKTKAGRLRFPHYEIYHPDYELWTQKLGARGAKVAPLMRNEEMVKKADALVAFHINESPGAQDIIDRAERRGLKVKVYHVI